MNEFCLETSSPVYRKALDFCEKVADSDANILLIGESGTGKEVAAKYIHHMSKRRSKSFVAVNCSAFTETLLESELFGHEQGSFTGATKSREGKVESANGGTMFLDEIGDTKPSTQIKLLRVIESKQVERIGSNVSRYIDFRLVSATNTNLNEAIRSTGFREDFFYRISTIVIRIPSLRERREDLYTLITFFMKKAQSDNNKTITHMVPEVRKFLYEYDYPGNVRELKNMIDRMVILSEDGVITKDCLPILYSMNSKALGEENKEGQSGVSGLGLDGAGNAGFGPDGLGGAGVEPGVPDGGSGNPKISFKLLQMPRFEQILPYREYKRQMEAGYLDWVLGQTGGNVSLAARMLQMSQRQLFNKINEHNLRK